MRQRTLRFNGTLMPPFFHCLLAYVLLTLGLQRSIWGIYDPVSLLLILMSLFTALAGIWRPKKRTVLTVGVWLGLSMLVLATTVLTHLNPSRPELAVLAAPALAAAGEFWPYHEAIVVAWIAVSLVVASVAICAPGRWIASPFAWISLAAFTLAQLLLLGMTSPERASVLSGCILAAVGAVVLSYLWPAMPGARWRFVLILAGYLFLGGRLILRMEPATDVWSLQRDASEQLVAGRNPYAAEYGNILPQFFDAGVIKNGKLQSFPYPPLSLLLDIPGYLAGDIRWSLLAATAASACFMIATGRRLGLPAGHPGELAVAALLCHPRALYVLNMAWTEPFLFLFISITAWALAGGRQIVAGFALAAAATVKQFGLLWILPAWRTGNLRWRKVVPGMLAALLVILPFLCQNPSAFWRGTVEIHTAGPLRADSLSVLSAIFLATGRKPPEILGIIAAIVVTWLVVWRSKNGIGSALLGEAAILLAFFAFSKAAHLNYYWLANAILALALLASAAEMRGADGQEAARGVALSTAGSAPTIR